MIDAFNALRDQAQRGIDRPWMKRAQALAVSVYRPRSDHPACAQRSLTGLDEHEIAGGGHAGDSLIHDFDRVPFELLAHRGCKLDTRDVTRRRPVIERVHRRHLPAQHALAFEQRGRQSAPRRIPRDDQGLNALPIHPAYCTNCVSTHRRRGVWSGSQRRHAEPSNRNCPRATSRSPSSQRGRA